MLWPAPEGMKPVDCVAVAVVWVTMPSESSMRIAVELGPVPLVTEVSATCPSSSGSASPTRKFAARITWIPMASPEVRSVPLAQTPEIDTSDTSSNVTGATVPVPSMVDELSVLSLKSAFHPPEMCMSDSAAPPRCSGSA